MTTREEDVERALTPLAAYNVIALQWCDEHGDGFDTDHYDHTCDVCVALRTIRAALASLPPDDGLERRFRHKKRGTTYRLIGYAQVKCATPLTEYEVVAVYRAETGPIDDEHGLWVRRKADFEDGRFEEIRSQPPKARAAMPSDALTMARDTLLFMHEMGGYVPENIRTAIHKIDAAQGNPPTELKCTTDHAGDGG